MSDSVVLQQIDLDTQPSRAEQRFPEDHSKASRRETPALTASSCDEQLPPLIPVTVVHVHESPERESPTSRLIPRWMLLAIFMLGLLLVFPFLRQPQSRHLPVQPERQQSVSAISRISRTPRTTEPASPAPQQIPSSSLRAPASVQGQQTAQAAPALQLPPNTSDIHPDPLLPPLTRVQGPHWLNIQATQEVWLSVMIDQVETKETFLKPGDQVKWVARTDFVVSVDKPNGVRLIFNGNVLPSLRERGQEWLPLHLPPTAADTEKAEAPPLP